MVVIITLTVLANTAVMVALWRVKRAPLHYPLISMVSADLLVGITVLPIAALRELFVFNLNRVICACWSTLDVLCCTASILSLCALGWERWSGITAPLARARRIRWSRTLAVLVWPVAILVALPAAFVPSPRHFHPGELEKACTVNVNTGYVFFSITFSFYLPACVLLTLYCFILKALASPPPIRAHRGPMSPCFQKQDSPRNKAVSSPNRTVHTDVNKNLAINLGVSPKVNNLNPPASNIACTDITTEKSGPKSSFIQRQRRATRTIVMLMALFFLCWTPYFVILPLDALYDIVRDNTWQWCTWLGYVNSALNPFVYAAASSCMRRALQSRTTSSRQNEIPLTPRIQRR